MIGAYASLAVIVAASVVVGLAVLSLAGRREPSWLAAPAGLALLLATAGIATGLADGATPVAVALAGVTVALLRRAAPSPPAGAGRLPCRRHARCLP